MTSATTQSTSTPASAASRRPLAIPASAKSTATTSQPWRASQMALRPSPHATSSARPGSSPPTSGGRKRFGSADQTSSVAGVALVPGRRVHVRRVAGRGCRARRAGRARRASGEPVIGSVPDCVFGKAITSRMFSSPARMATSRSMPKANPPCGGAPYSNGLRKKPNLRVGLLVGDAEGGEDPPLQLGLVDPDRARAELPAVEHEVVGLRAHRHRIGLEQVDVVGVGHRERVVAGLRAGPARRCRRTSGSRRPTRSGTGPRAPAAGRGRCAAGRAPRTSSSTRRRR